MAYKIVAHDPEPDEKPVVDVLPPVKFTQLFCYATRFELFLNAIGIVAAAAAGAALPLLAVLFGGLANKFASFRSVETAYLQDPNNPTLSKQFQDAVALFRHQTALHSLYLLYIGICILVSTFTYMVIWAYTGEVNAKRIREQYLQAVLRQDVAYFDTLGPGEVVTHIQTDTNLVQQGVSEKVAVVASYISSFFSGFIIAYVRCWKLALAVSSIVPCMSIAGAFTQVFLTKYAQATLKHVSDGSTLAEEVLSSVRTAHAFGTQKTLTSLFDVHIQQARDVGVSGAVSNGICFGSFSFFTYASYALAFQFGTTLINDGHATVGDLITVLLAILMGSTSLSMMAPEMEAIAIARAAAAKLFATIDRVPDIDSSDPNGRQLETVFGEVTLEDIHFSYPSRPNVPIVKGIDITFPAGKTAALVGPSGSGKSTIISLVERFYDPLSGSVKLDGVDIRDLNVKWLRSQIGLVSQEPTLFSTTIRANVAHGLFNTPYEHLSKEKQFVLIQEACIKANADDFISELPDGYDTLVGERGFLLSGGQKQRIAIARAIVSDPQILLLDEATSALDTHSEEVVQDALDRAAAGRTSIAIAHRLSTVKNADCIYVMGDGLVLERGTHAELLANDDSVYSRLVNAQKLRQLDRTEDCFGTTTMNSDEVTVCTENVGDWKDASVVDRHTIQDMTSYDKENVFQLFVRLGLLNRGELWRFAVGSVFAILTGIVLPLSGIIFGMFTMHLTWLYTHFPSGQGVFSLSEADPTVRRHEGNRNALWYLIIAIFATVTMVMQTYSFVSSAAILTSTMRSLIFKATIRQDIEYFDKTENSTGAVIARLGDYPQQVNGLAGVTLGTLVQILTTLIGGSIIGLAYAWKPALVAILGMPFIISAGYIRLRVVAMKDQHDKRAHQLSAQLACEAAASIRTVASLTREEDCLRIYSEFLEEPLRNLTRTDSLWSNVVYAFSQSASYYVLAAVFWYGTRLAADLKITSMELFVVLMSTTFGVMQVTNVISFVPDISSAGSAAAATFQLLDAVPSIDAESATGKTLKRNTVRGQIRFESVHFQYPTRPSVRVLRSLSIRAEPGTFVALVGASGCGKSTVIQLIERFYDPTYGRILLDGNPIDVLNVQEYRKQIALVSQEPTLYSGTIRFNILLGATKPESEVTQNEIDTACRDANILDFIQSLPDGFDTQVGGKGSQLSGGQKQRIAIARALLRNPKVLLLDEATSALDSHSEKVVQKALDQAAKGRTTIAIAHRLSTIQNADCIYFLEDGCVSESGTHEELLARRGNYYNYVQSQVLTS